MMHSIVCVSGCDINAVNDKNELPLYKAIDQRAKIDVRLKTSLFITFIDRKGVYIMFKIKLT